MPLPPPPKQHNIVTPVEQEHMSIIDEQVSYLYVTSLNGV
jgi:hypothetical protein